MLFGWSLQQARDCYPRETLRQNRRDWRQIWQETVRFWDGVQRLKANLDSLADLSPRPEIVTLKRLRKGVAESLWSKEIVTIERPWDGVAETEDCYHRERLWDSVTETEDRFVWSGWHLTEARDCYPRETLVGSCRALWSKEIVTIERVWDGVAETEDRFVQSGWHISLRPEIFTLQRLWQGVTESLWGKRLWHGVT